MPSTGTWNGTSYSVPLAGETNWASLSDFLIALRDNAQTTNFQKIGSRESTTTPVTVSAASDSAVGVNVGSAATVNLPAGSSGLVFHIYDSSGAATTNNITIDANSTETINGSLTYVISRNNAGITIAWNGTEWRIIAETPSGGTATGTGSNVLSISPTFTGTLSAAAITASGEVTASAEGFTVTTAGKGVTFTNGGNDILDHYETDTFTPTLHTSGAGFSVTYTTQYGRFVRIGKLIHVDLLIEILTVSGGSGVIFIRFTGLPVAANTTVRYSSMATEGVQMNGAAPLGVMGNLSTQNPQGAGSDTYLALSDWNDNLGRATINPATLAATDIFYITTSYIIA